MLNLSFSVTALLFLLTSLASAEAIVTVTCSAGDYQTSAEGRGRDSASASCVAPPGFEPTGLGTEGPWSYAEMHISINSSEGTLAYPAPGNRSEAKGLLPDPFDHRSWVPARTTATGWLSEQYYTAGPARAGLVRFYLAPYNNYFADTAFVSASLSFGPYSVQVPDFGCSGDFCNTPVMLPFQLGAPFPVEISIEGNTNANIMVPYDSIYGGADLPIFEVAFFEADGVTPVEVSRVPEPSSLLLLTGGLGLAAALARRSRR